MAGRKLRVSLKAQPVLTLNRVKLDGDQFVYVIQAKRKFHYANGSSRVVYIGTTSQGLARLAQSAAAKAAPLLSKHGVTSFDVRVITCRPRQKVLTWRVLERDLLLAFRDLYYAPPEFNIQGKNMRVRSTDFRHFSKSRLQKILRDLA